MPALNGFFDRELSRIDTEVVRLEAHLNSFAPDDPHGIGDRSLLRAQRGHRQWLAELAQWVNDSDTALDQCAARLMDAEQRHAVIAANGGAHDLRHAETWWDTLHEIQCMVDLMNRLRENHRQRST